MARKKKRDFWDDINNEEVMLEEPDHINHSTRINDEDTEYDETEGFKLTKSMPVKIAARLLLCVAAMVVALSGYICYKYVQDRYTDGVYSSTYFDSNGFSKAYNDSVNKLLRLISAVETEGEVTPERIAEMSASIMGTNSNFSYYILDENQQRLFVSSEDAKERIESSNHFLQINTLNNEFLVESGVPTSGLNKTAWRSALDQCNNAYNIYTAVDNNLAQQDSFYESYLNYQKMTGYFATAKIAGIVGLAVFILLLIYCVLSTGTRKGYEGVRLTWFDKIFTEIAALMIVAVVGALAYGLVYLMGHDVKFENWLKAGDVLLIYIFLIRGYFSLVRRIKGGIFITNSLIYKACHAFNRSLDHLPKALKIVIIVILLLLLNGGLVYALLNLRDYTVKNIPIIFIVAPVIFVIELIGFIGCIFGIGDEEGYYADDEQHGDPDAEDEETQEDTLDDWEDVDFSKTIRTEDVGVYEDNGQAGATVENIQKKVSDSTVVLSQEERQRVLDALGFGDTAAVSADKKSSVSDNTVILEPIRPETLTDEKAALQASAGDEKVDVSVSDETVILNTAEIAAAAGETVTGEKEPPEEPEKTVQDIAEELGYVDFIQLNKDVRKMYRMRLKARMIGVTLRAPEKPIFLDIDKSNAIKVLSILFENIEKYAQESSRVIIEMYAQNGKMIYLMKNTISEDRLANTTSEMGAGLNEAKRIVSAEKGKFINSVEGEIYKVGILLDVVEVKV